MHCSCHRLLHIETVLTSWLSFSRKRRAEWPRNTVLPGFSVWGAGRRWNPLLHLIIPLAAIAAFVPAWLTAAGIRVFSFVAPLTAPASYMAPGVAGFMVVGVIYLIYLYVRDPRRVTEVGLVHIDAPELEPTIRP